MKKSDAWFLEQPNRVIWRAELVKTAKKEVGNTESPAGSNLTKYGAWYGLNGMAWCGQFVSWVYDQTATRLNVPNPLARLQSTRGFAHCTTALATAKTRDKQGWTVGDKEKLLPGDIIIWDHDELPGGPGHTGIVVAVQGGGRFSTIEGNTNPSFSNAGGSVQRHDHTRIEINWKGHGRVAGVIRPTRRYVSA